MKIDSEHVLEISLSTLIRALKTEIDFPIGPWKLRFNSGNNDQGLSSHGSKDVTCGRLKWSTSEDVVIKRLSTS